MLFRLLILLSLFLPISAVAQERPAPPVVTAPAQMREMENRIEAIGTTKANESVEIRSKVTGIASAIKFNDGDMVDAGQLLVELDSKIEAAVKQETVAGLHEQRQELARVRELVKKKAVPTARLEETESRFKQAKAALEANLARLDDRKIFAPFSGVLGLRQISPGTLITPETVITTLDDLSVIKLDFTVPEVYLDSVTVGMEINAHSNAYEERSFAGMVTAIDTRIDPVTRAFTVRSQIPNPELLLKPGMLLRVNLIVSKQPRLVIPESAIIPVKDDQFVLVVGADNMVERRQIKAGHRYTGWVEVKDGLQEGEQVITEGTQKARDGAQVVPKSEKE